MVRQGQKEVTSMKARRYELTDKEWELIRPLIPISHTGRPQKDIRAHLNGILWLARSGARWSDLPARFGPHQTVYNACFPTISQAVMRIRARAHPRRDFLELGAFD